MGNKKLYGVTPNRKDGVVQGQRWLFSRSVVSNSLEPHRLQTLQVSLSFTVSVRGNESNKLSEAGESDKG